MSNYKFTVLSVTALLAVFIVAQASFARQGETVTAATSQKDEGGITMAFYAEDAPVQSCVSLFNGLPYSTTYMATDWDTTFRADWSSTNGVSLPTEQMIDLNGDGLVDYQYTSISSSTLSYTYTSCVYLNTGSGFEPVHRCKASLTVSGGVVTDQMYTGDCAG
ncbi:MAG: hypothetical protein AAB865_01525 [Patescibacteria group bacterium]